MESIQPQFIGAPCGSHGPYTFYKAVKFKKDGKIYILKLGEFFYFKILDDFPVCIGEIQLLWEEKGTNQLLTSVRLYFQPQDTPGEIQDGYVFGEDEVLAMSEKLIVSVEDLVVRLLPPSAPWAYGRPFLSYQDLPSSDPSVIMDSSPSLCTAFSSSNLLKINFDDVDKEREESGMKTEEILAPVAIMTYARYCRYRTVLMRLESLSEAWLKNMLVMAIGGITCMQRGVKVMFCREVFEYRDLEDLDFHLEHLAPNLKGRPRKRKMKKDDSDSNGYGSDQSSTASGSAPKVKSMRIQSRSESRNGISVAGKAKASEEERMFLKKLYKFMAIHDSPIDRLPSLGFKQIDLFEFYKAAKRLGGYQKICDTRQWKSLYDELGGHASSTSAATCTRRHYERLILPYENHLRKVQHARRREAFQKPTPALPPPMRDAGQNTQTPVQNGQMKDKAEKLEKGVDSEGVKKESNGIKGVSVKGEDELRTSTATNTGAEPGTVKMASTPTTPQQPPGSGPKVYNVEDLYHVEMKPTFVQRASPLEVPVVPRSASMSPMAPPHNKHSSLQHSADSKHAQPRDAKSLPFSTPHASSPYTISSSSSLRNDHFHKQQQQVAASLASAGGLSQQQQRASQLFSPLMLTAPPTGLAQVPSAHQRAIPSLFQHLKLTKEHLLNSKAVSEPSSAAAAVPLSRDPHVMASQPVLFQALPDPPLAHSNYVKDAMPPDILPMPLQFMPCHRHKEMRTNPEDRFPHPNQVLSRIHIQHQRPASSESSRRSGSSKNHSNHSASTSKSSAESSSHHMSLSSLSGGASLLSNGRDSGGGSQRRGKSSSQSSSSGAGSSSRNHHHHLPGPSSSSSLTGGVSGAALLGLASSHKDSHAERMAEVLQQQQSDVMLQSALFGAQFTALPRPTQPAEAYLPTLLAPHTAFSLGGQAFSASSAASPLAMYQGLTPAAQAQLLAYSEDMQRKALLSSATPFMMAASLQGAFASQHPSPHTKDSPHK